MAVADSPVMQQYRSIKARYPTAMVLFRMGDFYEILGDDAVAASDILQITLTKRRTAQKDDEGIPMCGMPHHAAEGYIGKLLAAGYKVALVEQTETPEQARKARGSGALVHRDVVRLYTPGTLTEDTYLDAATPTYLIAVCGNGTPTADRWEGYLAWLDVSTGEVGVRGVTAATLGPTLAAMPVGEAIADAGLEPRLLAILPRRQVSVQPGLFSPLTCQDALRRAYGLMDLAGLGLPHEAALTAAGALIGYAELTQMGRLPVLRLPRVVANRARLQIDPSTRKNLELTQSLAGRRADSLLGVLDRCATPAGSRLLSRWVAEPLTDVPAIALRQDAVAFFALRPDLRADLRNLLKQTGDVARCVSRLLLGRGGPRDLGVLRLTGQTLPRLADCLADCSGGLSGDPSGGGQLPPLLAEQLDGLHGLADLTALLHRALADDPLPALIRDGGFIRPGFDPELDGYARLVSDSSGLLQELEDREAAASGMALKIRYNQVWGYYLELTKAQLASSALPDHFIHRQTTTNTHRYTTRALMALEQDIGSASAKTQRREEELLATLLDAVKAASHALLAASEALATLDVLSSLADVAARLHWTRPLVDDSCAFDIKGGRHPVVASRVSTFVPNDCNLSGGKLWLLTGPNMAGKSTFLRQNALMVILAQTGSFVPADAAHIGTADAVFSRIGAADDLAAGQSTFMVEMTETAQILNRATSRSMVILDELGRGTATYDGLAIAWACVEEIALHTGCRTLFATHYHELTSLQGTLDAVSCWQVAVREWKGEIMFLHQVIEGAATGSYGVQVARLAGVPPRVVERAGALLDGFTKAAHGKGALRIGDLSLFAAPTQVSSAKPDNPIETHLKGMDVDGLSAREALEELYRLRGMLN